MPQVALCAWPLCSRLLFKRIISLSTMATVTMATTVRLGEVQGHAEKSNEVVVCRDWSTEPESHVLFFGGDVQDYKENMESHRDNHKYTEWNAESTAELLLKKYPRSLVSVIKPRKMHLHTFSVFSNFVESNMFGVPTHSPAQESWSHLVTLHNNILAEVRKKSRELASQCRSDAQQEDSCATELRITDIHSTVPVHIIGFSKGCVVLNQLLYDLTSCLKNDEILEIQGFVTNIKSITWLDGGHSGGSNTWITDDDVLAEFMTTGIRVFVHVTPYQVKDPMRNWIGKEEKKFVKKMRELGIDIKEILHFSDQRGCLEDHFEVIRIFTNL